MTITTYSFLFSFLWGSIFFLVLMPIRRYLLRHRAYGILMICSLFAIFRFAFIFDLNLALYSDLFYQMGEGVTLLVKKNIYNLVLQFSIQNNWNIWKHIYDFFNVFIYIWILGIFLLLRNNLVHIKRITNLYKEIPQSNNPELFLTLTRVKSDIKLNVDVRILESKYVQVPFLCGFFHPTIFLDTSSLNKNEIYAVLYHELTHFMRYDNWMKFLLHCTHIIFWWNPMIRILSENIYDACEYRCDQIVTQNMSSLQKIEYASIINRMTGKNPFTTSIDVLLVPKQSSDDVYDRLYTFLYPYKMKPTIKIFITSLAGVMITISLISILFISQTSSILAPTDITISPANSYLVRNEKGLYDLYCMDELIDINLTDLTGLSALTIK